MCFGSRQQPKPEPLPPAPTPEPEGGLQTEARRQRRRAVAGDESVRTTPLGATGFGQSSQRPQGQPQVFGQIGTAF